MNPTTTPPAQIGITHAERVARAIKVTGGTIADHHMMDKHRRRRKGHRGGRGKQALRITTKHHTKGFIAVPMKVRFRSCDRKVRYATPSDARRVIHNAQKYRQTTLFMYLCPFCNGYHLTKKPQFYQNRDRI